MPLSPNFHSLLENSGLDHGFFNRKGGTSTGLYESLNLGFGSDDRKDALMANRDLIINHFSGGKLATLYQYHSASVALIAKDNIDLASSRQIKADAMITKLPNIILGILTADCVPVLFADDQAGVIGAAHAGWRGAAGGILQNTISEMLSLGSKVERIKAVIGPAIAKKSYEVDQSFKDNIVNDFAFADKLFMIAQRGGHYWFDLPQFVNELLVQAGLQSKHIGHIDHDTYVASNDYFSYRRMTHLGQLDYGRQISCIMLKSN